MPQVRHANHKIRRAVENRTLRKHRSAYTGPEESSTRYAKSTNTRPTRPADLALMLQPPPCISVVIKLTVTAIISCNNRNIWIVAASLASEYNNNRVLPDAINCILKFQQVFINGEIEWNSAKTKGKLCTPTSVGFRSWSRSSAVSPQVTENINPAVGCRHFRQARGYHPSRRANTDNI